MNNTSTRLVPGPTRELRRARSFARLAVLGAVFAAGAALPALAQETSRLDFNAETIDIGDSISLTFTLDPAHVGHRVKLLTGSNLGPTPMGDWLVPIGGAINRRGMFDSGAVETVVEYPLSAAHAGKTFVLVFTTSIDEVVTSVSNIVSVQFSSSDATFKHVPVPTGYAWVPGDTGVTHDLKTVAFADDERGFAGGPNSTLWVTDDGGRNWAPQVIDDQVKTTIRDVEFADENHGFAIGSYFSGIVWVTIDGGRTWARKGVNIVPFAVDFVDPLTGWVVGLPSPFGGGGPIAKTTDGGTTWVMQARTFQEEVRSVKFSDRQHGIAAGRNGLVLMTSDGGATWVRKTLPAAYRTSYLMAADMESAGDVATVAGYDSVVLRTTDGGATWRSQRVPPERAFLSIAFTSPLRGWLVGDRGSILWTFDGGETWLPFEPNGAAENETFNKIFALDRDSLWAVGDSGQFRAFTDVENP